MKVYGAYLSHSYINNSTANKEIMNHELKNIFKKMGDNRIFIRAHNFLS